MIPFNKPYLTGKEIEYLQEAVANGKLSGNGVFTQKCHQFFTSNYNFQKCLLTTSCTDALEMSALLLDIKPGDEVIVPSYTFVSTALAFVRQGAKIVFADSKSDHPNIDETQIESLITKKTKAIVVVHYAGMACEMDEILKIASKYGLVVVEDAAQAIDSFYKGKPLGGIGQLASFSFHETKNVISGEGGMLVINDPKFEFRSEILWEKGTNRAEFFRGQVNKYGWVDTGSSFLPSELTAAFLYAQLEYLRDIQDKRITIWRRYQESFQELAESGKITLPVIPDYATNNAHMFYLLCEDIDQRDEFINHLRSKDILAVFHYQSLHSSPFYNSKHDGRNLPNCDHFNDCLVRLPLYYELSYDQQSAVIDAVHTFYQK
ncbi:MAG: dTDP-4-amino-4,6-dideoxygalactose transaminase [Cyclobacteriaceae bacterium]|nr:dTDP-4-amino-4,6-dideoxygalactose transaminase [Cyclobacteriaceae bacterium]